MSARGAAVVFGAGGGLGRALVYELVSSGAFGTVHAGSRSGTGTIPGSSGFSFDLLDEASIATAVAAIPDPIRLVIVATGVLHDATRGVSPEKSWRALDPRVVGEVMAVNAIGPALIAKHILPRFPRGERAVFAALSARVGSIADNRLGGWHSYRASKAALNMMVRNFAIELARSHPQALVVTLHPGTVATPLSEPFRSLRKTGILSSTESARRMLSVLKKLGPKDSGGLFAWDGQRLPF